MPEPRQLVAGPFAVNTLADFGAETIKMEPPEACDALSKWRLFREGASVGCATQPCNSLAAEWLPPPHVLHPWPEDRLIVKS